MSGTALQRVIALVDMDCFYCQVEARLEPSLKGKPVAVVQYNQWKGGGIIAVNYEARDLGVTRYMRGAEAKEKCPEINLVSVPCVRGKADLTKYREAGDEVAEVFSEFSDCVQRASIDEAFIDLTKAVNERIKNGVPNIKAEDLPSTFIVGHCDLKSNDNDLRSEGLNEWLSHVDNQQTSESPDFRLAVGALIIEEMRNRILEKTGFHCSAGIAHNKILAKLVAGMHKPKCQTVLPHDGVPELYDTLPVHKVRSLGGKLGKLVSEKFSVKYMSELYKFSLQEMQQKLDEKNGAWLYNIARGIDLDPVTPRLIPESIGCCKNFPGANALKSATAVKKWTNELAAEISERLSKDLEKNKRRAKLVTVSFYQETAMSRSGSLSSYEKGAIVKDVMGLLNKFNNATSSTDSWHPPIKFLGISVSKFTEEKSSIGKYLKNLGASSEKATENSDRKKSPEDEKPADEIKIKIETNITNKPDIGEFFRKSQTPANDSEPENASKILPETSEEKNPSSFFLSFLNKNKEFSNREAEDDNYSENSEEMWISLSEVFPNVAEADDEVVDILPREMKAKLKERMKKADDDALDLNDGPSTSKGIGAGVVPADSKPTALKLIKDEPKSQTGTEICSECKKQIFLDDFLEHLDYHAAVKLHAEINRPAVNKSGKNTTPVKRKKSSKDSKLTDKKMRSITSFFSVVPK